MGKTGRPVKRIPGANVFMVKLYGLNPFLSIRGEKKTLPGGQNGKGKEFLIEVIAYA